jgi:hypothetical protein
MHELDDADPLPNLLRFIFSSLLASPRDTITRRMRMVCHFENKSLRLGVNQGNKRWMQRTPAMAEGLTDHIWTLKELMSFRVPGSIRHVNDQCC